jgi:hypothetical protein
LKLLLSLVEVRPRLQYWECLGQCFLLTAGGGSTALRERRRSRRGVLCHKRHKQPGEEARDGSALAKLEASTRSLALLDDFVSSSEGLRLVQSFMRIESAGVRRRIVALVQEISDHQDVAG